jgi:hypothetical protein
MEKYYVELEVQKLEDEAIQLNKSLKEHIRYLEKLDVLQKRVELLEERVMALEAPDYD